MTQPIYLIVGYCSQSLFSWSVVKFRLHAHLERVSFHTSFFLPLFLNFLFLQPHNIMPFLEYLEAYASLHLKNEVFNFKIWAILVLQGSHSVKILLIQFYPFSPCVAWPWSWSCGFPQSSCYLTDQLLKTRCRPKQ